ncbi:MAG: hypothetical protein M3376_07975 [Actinomycetota bacterium]|nr:hypothetical protein [Actinomycetota bacterium]
MTRFALFAPFVYGAAWLVLIVLVVRAARAGERRTRVARECLSAPVAPAPFPAARGRAASPVARSGRGGRQTSPGAAQERQARDALCCAGGRVDAAPIGCPVDEGPVA